MDRPKRRDRLADLELAYNSQYYAGGGAVVKAAAKDSLDALVQYLGGYRRNPVEGLAQWADRPDTDLLAKLKSERVPASVKEPVADYSAAGYRDINDWLREHGPYADISTLLRKPDPLGKIDDYYGPSGALKQIAARDQRTRNVLNLSKVLRSQPYELPSDIFRGAYVYKPQDDFGFSKVPQVHGVGLGSFSFDPYTAESFTSPNPKMYPDSIWADQDRAPAMVRIKKGENVLGRPIMGDSSHPEEKEFLMAPRQGFDVTDLWRTKTGLPLIDISPTEDFTYFSPQIYAEGGQVAHKLTKSSVDYSMGMGKTRCRNCAHFQKPHGCALVAGKIDPGYWCQKFTAAYAEGGVTLPNLPSKGVPQSGPMHYGSDEEGFAEGGQFLRFVKNLVGQMTPTESVAADFVRKHAADTGKEALVYGRRDVPYSGVALGTERAVKLPEDWIQNIRKGPDYPLFTAHSHPRETPTPSAGDLNVWSNINDATKGIPQDQLARQFMWITGAKGTNDLSVLEPATREIGRRAQDVTMANDVNMRRLAGTPSMRKEMYGMLGDVADDYFGKYTMPNSERHAAISNLEQGVFGNRLSQYVPLHYDPLAPVISSRDATIGDLWPEAVDYLNSKGFQPYAEGGKVDDEQKRRWLLYAGFLNDGT